MHRRVVGPHAGSVAELRAQLEAERTGFPFLVFRDDGGAQRIMILDGEQGPVTIGRESPALVCLGWDEKVSRLHANLEPIASSWVLVDDGLSRNGSYVNGDRVTGRRRLRDGDLMRFGATEMAFRFPGKDAARPSTAFDTTVRNAVRLSDTQRSVLIALCRPFKDAPGFAIPASNREIAAEVFLSIDAVKAHLRTLFEKFGLADLPQAEKRVRLVEAAFKTGALTERDL
jgi:pSer/pThr/pTyr-binding forkhead associated (FHA) protein